MAVVLGDNNMADDAANDTKQLESASHAVKMGKDAAKTAKTLTKAGAHAAAGDFAGAAAEVATDPETLKKILFIILAPLLVFALLVTTCLYALPTAIYDSICSIIEELQVTYYSSSSIPDLIGKLVKSAATSIIDAAAGFLQSAWTTVKGWFFGGSNDVENQTEDLSAANKDIGMFGNESQERLSIIRKAVATNDKYMVRAKQITNALNSNKDAIEAWLLPYCTPGYEWKGVKYNDSTAIIPTGTTSDTTVSGTSTPLLPYLNGLAEQANAAATLAEREAKSDEFVSTVTANFPQAENSAALAILSLIMAQQGGSLDDIKMSEYMKLLGYHTMIGGPKKTQFDIGYIVDDTQKIWGTVEDWNGTFKLQHSMEELKNYRDWRLMEDSLPASEKNPAEIYRLDGLISAMEGEGVPLIDLITRFSFPDLNCGSLSSETVTESGPGLIIRTTTYDNPRGGGVLRRIDKDIYVPPTPTGGGYWLYFCWFEIEYYIEPRPISLVADKAGLWQGGLSDTLYGASPP